MAIPIRGITGRIVGCIGRLRIESRGQTRRGRGLELKILITNQTRVASHVVFLVRRIHAVLLKAGKVSGRVFDGSGRMLRQARRLVVNTLLGRAIRLRSPADGQRKRDDVLEKLLLPLKNALYIQTIFVPLVGQLEHFLGLGRQACGAGVRVEHGYLSAVYLRDLDEALFGYVKLGTLIEQGLEVGRRVVQNAFGGIRMQGDFGRARTHHLDELGGQVVLFPVALR